ncbi:MAG: alpha/beta fold hydrolase [Hoeflea sp.]|uniref:alpha/beta fold hydrolase n=1 Tax=Hoeflea sp. TaxID=1940281 RepID=UPI0027303033|nr:alpha/beta fold hydrolase [Hoeflea sp.]MDP2119482.1 alpha/beta fold hydrolase [Hoeflea sp.]
MGSLVKMQDSLAHSDRLLNLLDKAYDAPFRPDSFDDLMTAAHDFYFTEPDDLSSHALKQADYENNATISSHLSRIERLLNERELENRSHASQINSPALSTLLIDPETGMVEGNWRAREFFGHGFPVSLKQLNLDASSRTQLLKMARSAVLSDGLHSDICLIKRKDDAAAHLAKCGRWVKSEYTSGATARGLAVSIVHFEWTAEALRFCQTMFDLSVSETEVLAALLNGKSQPEIAEARFRSVETIKSQSKAILRKSGCRKIADLLVLATTYGLLVDPGRIPSVGTPGSFPLFARPDRIFKRPDGRKISYGVYGDPAGKPVLFVHGLVHGPFFPSDMIETFKRDGLRFIAPSRPSFGQTDAPADWTEFNSVVVDDMRLLLPEIARGKMTVIAHQGGVSHACRIAHALGDQVRNMVMVSAGIPIDEKRHLPHMGVQTRIAALGVKYTPRILETMIHIGIVNWQRKGLKPYAEHLFSNSPTDLVHLEDPRIYPICEAGILHMIAQGAKAIIYDGKAAMADWESDFLKLTCPVKWLHGTRDPIIRPDFIEEFVAAHGGAPVELIENGGNTMHLSHSDIFHRVIAEAVFG